MQKTTIRLTGDKELKRKIAALEEAVVGQVVEKAAMAAAVVLRDSAKRRAPRRTGKGAESMTAKVVSRKAGEAKIAVGPGKEGWYLMFHEFGTSKMPARPFLRPAIDENGEEAVREARRVLWDEIMGVVR